MYTGGDELLLLGLGKAALKGIIKHGKVVLHLQQKVLLILQNLLFLKK